jgi:hypothetical protein
MKRQQVQWVEYPITHKIHRSFPALSRHPSRSMSATVTLELPSLEERRSLPEEPEQAYGANTDAPVARAKQKWNEPSINKWRIAAAFASFAVVGASDGVYGVSTTDPADEFV